MLADVTPNEDPFNLDDLEWDKHSDIYNYSKGDLGLKSDLGRFVSDLGRDSDMNHKNNQRRPSLFQVGQDLSRLDLANMADLGLRNLSIGRSRDLHRPVRTRLEHERPNVMGRDYLEQGDLGRGHHGRSSPMCSRTGVSDRETAVLSPEPSQDDVDFLWDEVRQFLLFRIF